MVKAYIKHLLKNIVNDKHTPVLREIVEGLFKPLLTKAKAVRWITSFFIGSNFLITRMGKEQLRLKFSNIGLFMLELSAHEYHKKLLFDLHQACR